MCALSVSTNTPPQCCVFREIRFWLYLAFLPDSALNWVILSDYCHQWRDRTVRHNQPSRVRIWLRPDGEKGRLRPVELVESLGGNCAKVVKILNFRVESAFQPQTRRHSRVSDIFDWWERHYSDQYDFQRNDHFGQFGAADSLQFPGTNILKPPAASLEVALQRVVISALSNQLLDIVQDSIIFWSEIA